MEINDILHGFNNDSDCDDDCMDNDCGFGNDCGCGNNGCGGGNNCGCGNNNICLIILLLVLCGGCGSQGGNGGCGNMGNNCCCCCCEKPKFKKCTETVYVPECGYPAYGYGNAGMGGNCGFGNESWWIIILLLLFCGGNGFGGNCGGCGNC
ncbi:MAG: hypothetical protein RSF37_03985 [Clostridium sp.]|uniref:hypothetical protein n=1 Tax=Clostridium sp. TaxID=1506 RepID=UPI002FC61340